MWEQWIADFLPGFGVMALVGLASYRILRSDSDFCRLLREIGLFVYAVFGCLLLTLLVLPGADWELCGLGMCGLVFFAALQTPLEQANNRRQLSWGDQFVLALFTYFYSLGNSLVLMIGLAMLGFFPADWAPNRAYTLGIWLGVWLTPFSISFFRWMFAGLSQRPGLDRAFDTEEVNALTNSDHT